jgi:hypothetical protein
VRVLFCLLFSVFFFVCFLLAFSLVVCVLKAFCFLKALQRLKTGVALIVFFSWEGCCTACEIR